MRTPLSALLAVLLIDGIGLGLILPILPGLLQQLAGAETPHSLHYGALLSLYALMQFLCAPLLGALSDRHGRRRVLLVSLAGAALDYLLMAVAPSLPWLYLGRALAGVTGANMAVAAAYLTDITPPGQRAARFGQMGAAFGIGLIAGPVLGGLLGEWLLRAPFLLAAALNALNLLLVWRRLPESRPARPPEHRRISLNAFAALHRLSRRPGLAPLLGIYAVVTLVGQWPATLWILYGQDRFGWSMTVAGLSLAGYGLCHAVTQAFAVAPLVARLGERRALLLGLAGDSLGLLLLSLALSGWVPFLLLPLFAAGGLAAPALQSMLTRRIDDHQQGELQGTLTGITSLIGIAGPLLVTTLYALSHSPWPGLVWAVGAATNLLVLPLLLGRRRADTAIAETAESTMQARADKQQAQ
ncbi:Tet(A)/Tet(B)/Tet(C) family tetracycline efflux MFS transporter [Stenotrophomonas mori]|uniref:Tet(A)/Tet(B)/Tet(C) family tetracycline efflux MFS transporter n=1 Tax=Stenotrophomonas mori TaxID=2871096 RepID=A0ABT0SJU8_9GAMM|nr:Tet(A)/Tet(B)/Tet(C) family tetracycline efflux MFS transporter [Stenotrophomonas mori]MCL7715601.1 Tet(A)/Tet(B)/Tet(C) family tetracycline efflux MFS transporter [Stenotrophomonas mori]